MTQQASLRQITALHIQSLATLPRGQRIIYGLSLLGPATVGGFLAYFGVRVGSGTGDVLTGLSVMCAVTFGLMIWVFQTRASIKRDDTLAADSLALRTLNEAFHNVTYSTLAGLAGVLWGTLGSVTWGNRLPLSDLLSDDAWGGIHTAVLVTLVLHYLATLGICIRQFTLLYQRTVLNQ